jgi:MFS family permease
LVLATFLMHLGLLAQQVALGYDLYLRTKNPLTLGFIGLAEAIPFISLALFGGHLADTREKRSLMLFALVLVLAATAGLIWASAPAASAQLGEHGNLGAIYAMVALLGVARVFFSPSASALRAFLVPRPVYGNAATWSSASWQAASVLGPLAGGVAYAAFGLQNTLIATWLCMLLALLAVLGISPRGVAVLQRAESIWTSLAEGLSFVRRTPIVFYALALDLFSVLFGGVVAILPVFAEDILKVGPTGAGLMRAAPSVGALLTLLLCAWWPPTEKAWRNLLLAIAGFGLATLLFALSKVLWLSLIALFATGAFDSISVIIRSTILQVLPPDHLRGRVQAVTSVFISSSNELGAFESGVAARFLGTVPSVLWGASATLAIVAAVALRTRNLLAVRLR